MKYSTWMLKVNSSVSVNRVFITVTTLRSLRHSQNWEDPPLTIYTQPIPSLKTRCGSPYCKPPGSLQLESPGLSWNADLTERATFTNENSYLESGDLGFQGSLSAFGGISSELFDFGIKLFNLEKTTNGGHTHSWTPLTWHVVLYRHKLWVEFLVLPFVIWVA